MRNRILAICAWKVFPWCHGYTKYTQRIKELQSLPGLNGIEDLLNLEVKRSVI